MNIELDEIFKDCPYNYSLQVSQYGRVKNKFTDEIMEQTIFNECYIVNNPIKYKQPNNQAFEWVHRLVALTWITDVPNYGIIVHHKNNNGFDNRFDNLEWVNEELHKKIHNIE